MSKMNIRENINMACFTWFKVGGTVKYFFMPKNVEEMIEGIKLYKNKIKNIRCIGAGSNLLITENVHDYLIIKTMSMNSMTVLDNNLVNYESGTLSMMASKFAMDNEFGGLEFLYTIPGTIGGNVKLNAGCYGSEVKDVFVEAMAVDTDGQLHKLLPADLQFSYRNSLLPDDLFIISSTFKTLPKLKDEIWQIMCKNKEQRELTQPTSGKTCGSTFKNPPGYRAWELIKESGANTYEYNGVKFSSLHCNFIINDSKSANDIVHFIEEVQKIVFNKTKIQLEPEIHFI